MAVWKLLVGCCSGIEWVGGGRWVAVNCWLGVAVGYSGWRDWEMGGWKLLVVCCSGLHWLGGLGDGWLETAGRLLQWFTVGRGEGDGWLETAGRVLQWVSMVGRTER